MHVLPSAFRDPQPATLNFSTNSLASIWGRRLPCRRRQPAASGRAPKQLQQAPGEIHRGQQHKGTAGSCISADGRMESNGKRRATLAQKRRQACSWRGQAQPAPRSSPRATPGACRAHPSHPFPLENRELFKTLVKNDALPKPCLIHPLPLPPRAELQPSPAAKDNTVEKGMLYCAPSYWRKWHFYLSKTTFPFYRWQKKDCPHLSALHNPATASKQCLPGKKILGKRFVPGSQTVRGCSTWKPRKQQWRVSARSGDHWFGKAVTWEDYTH